LASDFVGNDIAAAPGFLANLNGLAIFATALAAALSYLARRFRPVGETFWTAAAQWAEQRQGPSAGKPESQPGGLATPWRNQLRGAIVFVDPRQHPPGDHWSG
jgi:hypothetical protein